MTVSKVQSELADEVAKAIHDNGGYCCCQIKSDDSICMCKDFRDKISDPNFEGECECGLYIKHLDDKDKKINELVKATDDLFEKESENENK